jgi:acyl-coenzyme A thioesterase PaaI-like protein
VEDAEATDEEASKARWERQTRHFEARVPFNRAAGVKVLRWDHEEVVMHLPHAEWLCNSTDGFHGGVVASLADTCGSVATTDLTATGVCIKPGRRVQVAEVLVRDTLDRLVAEAIVTSTLPG